MSEEDGLDDWADAMEEQADDKGKTEVEFGTDAEIAELEEFDEDHEVTSNEKRKLDTILDIPVTIAMEVGRTNISIRNLLQLNQGSVVELDRVAGEPLDVLVNGTLIAHGEVVVVNDKFGIRLTDVISQLERIKKIR
jgi:flagellar motor switch protein FliN/FliY